MEGFFGAKGDGFRKQSLTRWKFTRGTLLGKDWWLSDESILYILYRGVYRKDAYMMGPPYCGSALYLSRCENNELTFLSRDNLS